MERWAAFPVLSPIISIDTYHTHILYVIASIADVTLVISVTNVSHHLQQCGREEGGGYREADTQGISRCSRERSSAASIDVE